MRYLSILLIFLVSVSCVTTQGTRIKALDARKPYIFQCSADTEQCADAIKRVMVRNSFEVQNEDIEAGVLAARKTLSSKEKIQTSAFTEAMTGVQSDSQQGRLSFIFEDDGTLEMGSEIVVGFSQQEGFTREESDEVITPVQGHPLMVKYGQALEETGVLTLLSPSPEDLKKKQSQ